MEAIMIYLLKASGILTLFYVVYQVFLKKETFYKVNRHFLMTGVIAAFLCPFIVINNYVEITTTAFAAASPLQSNSPITMNEALFRWKDLIYWIYGIGITMLGIKFILQFLAIRKVIRSNNIIRKDGYIYVETNKDIAPFSFFRYIFYNPNNFDKLELESILKHERAHSSQQHSLDLLVAHLVAIIMWINPFSWLYKKNIEQNLEFLADNTAIKKVSSSRVYKYTLLKVSGNQFFTPITNNFYSSLIKKRIVMLHKSKSKKRNAFKMALILPALAVFLLSFNTRTIYIPKTDQGFGVASTVTTSLKTIEVLINKDTTNEELEEIKKDLSAKGIDFSYTVVHNENKEIIALEIDMRSKEKDGKNFRGSSSFENDGKPIDPITIVYDEDNNSFFMGDKKSRHNVLHEETEVNTWVFSDDEEHKHIEIKIEDGKETIKVNGKEVSRKELNINKEEDGIHEKHIKIKKSHGDKEENVFIMKISDDDDIIAVEEKGKEMFFISGDSDEKPIFIIDGKESKEKDMKKLDPSEIATINVYKGDKAKEKYGEKAKDGVIVIKTKKEN